MRSEHAHRLQELDARHPTRLRRAGPGRVGRVEHVDVDGQERCPVADDLQRALDDGVDPEVAHVVHEERRDALFALPAELGLAGPIAAQTDLDVARRIDMPVAHQPVHRRPVRDLDAEHGRPGVGVRVEVDERHGPVPLGTGGDVGLGDRVVAAEHDRDQPRVEHLTDCLLDRGVRAHGIGGQHGCVAVVDDAQLGERVDLRLEVRAGRAARRANRPRAVAGAGAIRDEVVRRRTDDRDVEAGEQLLVLRVRGTAEADGACEIGLFAVGAPALERVDHGGIVAASSRCCTGETPFWVRSRIVPS